MIAYIDDLPWRLTPNENVLYELLSEDILLDVQHLVQIYVYLWDLVLLHTRVKTNSEEKDICTIALWSVNKI